MNQTTLTILLPLLSFTGVVIGAFLQSFLQLRREKVTQKQTLKIKAYTDYLHAVSTLSGNLDKHDEARIQLTDAKMRILIYGSPRVIENIAALDRIGSNLRSVDGAKAFVLVTSAMREDGAQQKVRREDISQILFSRDTLDSL
jgi:hypothetical protein